MVAIHVKYIIATICYDRLMLISNIVAMTIGDIIIIMLCVYITHDHCNYACVTLKHYMDD